MKKLFLFLFVFAVCACATAKPKEVETSCTIKGVDCWQIVQMLDNTQEAPANDEVAKTDWWNIPNGTKYINADLKALGLEITHHIMYRNGSFTDVIEGEGVEVGIKRDVAIGTADYDTTTVKFKDGPTFNYDKDGNLVK